MKVLCIPNIAAQRDEAHPLSELKEGKAKVRSALNRAARKTGRILATASDSEFLYIWNATRAPKEHRG